MVILRAYVELGFLLNHKNRLGEPTIHLEDLETQPLPKAADGLSQTDGA